MQNFPHVYADYIEKPFFGMHWSDKQTKHEQSLTQRAVDGEDIVNRMTLVNLQLYVEFPENSSTMVCKFSLPVVTFCYTRISSELITWSTVLTYLSLLVHVLWRFLAQSEVYGNRSFFLYDLFAIPNTRVCQTACKVMKIWVWQLTPLHRTVVIY